MKRFRHRIQLFSVALLALGLLSAKVFAEEVILTPHTVAEIRTVTSAAISPDGKLVAYTLNVPRKTGEEEDGAAWVELHLIDLDAGEGRPFVSGEVNVAAIDWVPTKLLISFVAKRGDDAYKSLYTIPADGGEARKILELGSDILSYSWSPDGNRVAVVATEPEADDVRKLKENGFTQEVYEEDWRARKVFRAAPFEPDSKSENDALVQALSLGTRHRPSGLCSLL